MAANQAAGCVSNREFLAVQRAGDLLINNLFSFFFLLHLGRDSLAITTQVSHAHIFGAAGQRLPLPGPMPMHLAEAICTCATPINLYPPPRHALILIHSLRLELKQLKGGRHTLAAFRFLFFAFAVWAVLPSLPPSPVLAWLSGLGWPGLAWPGLGTAHKSTDPASAGGNYRDMINKYFCI